MRAMRFCSKRFTLSLRRDAPPSRVRVLGSSEHELPFTWDGTRVTFTVDALSLFAMFALE